MPVFACLARLLSWRPSCLVGAVVASSCFLGSASASAQEYMVFDRDHAVWRADADGSNTKRLTPETRTFPYNQRYKTPALSPDGQQVAYTDDWNIQLVDIHGTLNQVIYKSNWVGYLNELNTDLQWSPDGEHLIFMHNGDIYTLRPGDPGLTPLLRWPLDQAGPVYSADGSKLVFTSHGTPTGVEHSGGAQLYIANSDGSAPRVLTKANRSFDWVHDPTISPDGSQIIFSGDPANTSNDFSKNDPELFVINADGSGLRALTDNSVGEDRPSWSMSGLTIAFERDGDLYRMNSNGTSVTKLIADDLWTSRVAQRQPNRAFNPSTALRKYVPQLQYDSQEAYFAESAAMMTDNYLPGSSLPDDSNRLEREDSTDLAWANPTLGRQLSLDFLGWPNYANGVPASDTDHIDALNSYAEDAARMRSNAFYSNRVYGRAKRDTAGRWWLQYWFFYYYNPWSPLGTGQGVHEGDWEMMQLGLDSNGAPETVTLSQHHDPDAERCAYSVLHKRWNSSHELTPWVFPSQGSHATYTDPGGHTLFTDVVQDTNDGQGPVAEPLLIEITDTTAWIAWRGAWGGSESSPRGPAQQGSKWSAPDLFHAQAHSCQATSTGAVAAKVRGRPSAPRIAPQQAAGSVQVEYRLTRGRTRSTRPKSLLLTVHSSDSMIPPSRTQLRVNTLSGKAKLPLPGGPGPYAVRASAFAKNGARSRVVTQKLE